ncbi:ABC transporter ATP-binding protein [Microbacterium sp. A588]
MSDPFTLRVRGLRAGYSSMEAVSGVELDVPLGEITSLIGRNGAGKTTALLAIAGSRQGSNGGSVLLGDVDVSKASAPEIVKAGLSHVPEGHRIFKELTVEENLRLGAWVHRRTSKKSTEGIDRVYDLFPILKEFSGRDAGFLSGGQQQMVAIGQALMARPRILMLDEPTSGLALPVIASILEVLHRLKDDGMGILLVDQGIQRALDNSSTTYVMDQGAIVISGPSKELASNPRVFDIVRGTDEAPHHPSPTP